MVTIGILAIGLLVAFLVGYLVVCGIALCIKERRYMAGLEQETARLLEYYERANKLHLELDIDHIDSRTLVAALFFLAGLYRLVIGSGLEWKSPHISTEGRGEVTFEWQSEPIKHLAFIINPTGENEYVLAWGPHINTEMESGENPSNDKILELWRRLGW